MIKRRIAVLLLICQVFSGCSTIVKPPYTGVNPQNSQFERGIPVLPLDLFGDLISKIYQLLFWNKHYGNHQITEETEAAIAGFIAKNDMKDVKVRLNQWAPHKEIGRLITNPHLGWPYKILYFPSTLIVSLIARPFSGLLISDYYDPGSNSIHIFSDDTAIALHESGHALDFFRAEHKGTYALARIIPGVNLIQEAIATDEALHHLEAEGEYQELLDAYKTLYPAYSTYVASYLASAPVALLGALTIGHIIGRTRSGEKKQELIDRRKIKADDVKGGKILY